MRWNNTVLSVSDMFYLTQIINSSKMVRIADIPIVWGSIPIPSTKLLSNTIDVLSELNYVTTTQEHICPQPDISIGQEIKEFKSSVGDKLWSIVHDIGLNKVTSVDAFLVIDSSTIQLNVDSIKNEYKTLINLVIQCSDSRYEGNFVIIKTKTDAFGKFKYYRDVFTSAMQRQELEEKARIGKIAENYVFNLEKNYLTTLGANEAPILYAEDDVGIGYDVLSYELESGQIKPKYIEVKAITKRNRFFISRNEVKTAHEYGNSYWLYLVYIENYKVKELEKYCNPYDYFFKKENDWNLEVESYRFAKR